MQFCGRLVEDYSNRPYGKYVPYPRMVRNRKSFERILNNIWDKGLDTESKIRLLTHFGGVDKDDPRFRSLAKDWAIYLYRESLNRKVSEVDMNKWSFGAYPNMKELLQFLSNSTPQTTIDESNIGNQLKCKLKLRGSWSEILCMLTECAGNILGVNLNNPWEDESVFMVPVYLYLNELLVQEFDKPDFTKFEREFDEFDDEMFYALVDELLSNGSDLDEEMRSRCVKDLDNFCSKFLGNTFKGLVDRGFKSMIVDAAGSHPTSPILQRKIKEEKAKNEWDYEVARYCGETGVAF